MSASFSRLGWQTGRMPGLGPEDGALRIWGVEWWCDGRDGWGAEGAVSGASDWAPRAWRDLTSGP